MCLLPVAVTLVSCVQGVFQEASKSAVLGTDLARLSTALRASSPDEAAAAFGQLRLRDPERAELLQRLAERLRQREDESTYYSMPVVVMDNTPDLSDILYHVGGDLQAGFDDDDSIDDFFRRKRLDNGVGDSGIFDTLGALQDAAGWHDAHESRLEKGQVYQKVCQNGHCKEYKRDCKNDACTEISTESEMKTPTGSAATETPVVTQERMQPHLAHRHRSIFDALSPDLGDMQQGRSIFENLGFGSPRFGHWQRKNRTRSANSTVFSNASSASSSWSASSEIHMVNGTMYKKVCQNGNCTETKEKCKSWNCQPTSLYYVGS